MGAVLLIVRVKFLRVRNHAAVHRVSLLAHDLDHDGLAHLGGDHVANLGLTLGSGLGSRFNHYFFSPASWRCRAMVLTRAISRRRPRIFLRLSVCPMLSWNLRRKSWSLSSRSWCLSSASVKFLIFSASINSVLSYQFSVSR